MLEGLESGPAILTDEAYWDNKGSAHETEKIAR
jgi:hypothetical protein